jgi:protein-S-isoprenylcysteine O-methyltransferase Ste14
LTAPGPTTAQRPASETAGVIALPPLIYAAGLGAGLLLDWLLPSLDLPGSLRWLLGGALCAAGAALQTWFILGFRRARTAVDPREPTTALVTTGPYRLTRNPAYLGLALLYAGIALLANAPWALVTLAPTLAVVNWGVIKREERYLERLFGDDYLRFKARTRRWI